MLIEREDEHIIKSLINKTHVSRMISQDESVRLVKMCSVPRVYSFQSAPLKWILFPKGP